MSQVKNMGGIGAHCIEDFRTLQMFVEAPSMYKDTHAAKCLRMLHTAHAHLHIVLQMFIDVRDMPHASSGVTRSRGPHAFPPKEHKETFKLHCVEKCFPDHGILLALRVLKLPLKIRDDAQLRARSKV